MKVHKLWPKWYIVQAPWQKILEFNFRGSIDFMPKIQNPKFSKTTQILGGPRPPWWPQIKKSHNIKCSRNSIIGGSIWCENAKLQKKNILLVRTKHQRFCKNHHNRYRDDTRQAKNHQNHIVMIPWQYWNHIGSDTWCFVNTRRYQLIPGLSGIVWYC